MLFYFLLLWINGYIHCLVTLYQSIHVVISEDDESKVKIIKYLNCDCCVSIIDHLNHVFFLLVERPVRNHTAFIIRPCMLV